MSIKVLLPIVSSKKNSKNDNKSPVHKSGYCTWYGQCKTVTPGSKDWYNCFKPRKAKTLNDQDGLDILKEYCPSIYGDGEKVKTCCDTAQLTNLKNNMEVPYTVCN